MIWFWKKKIDLDDSVSWTNKSIECKCDNGNADDTIKDYKLNKKKDDLGFMKEDEGIVKCSNNTACNIMCEDHLVDPQEDAIWLNDNKKARLVSKSTTSHTKKWVVAKTSNPNEFYYYSGFGPSWGKKRGELGSKGTTSNARDADFTSNSNIYEAIGGVCDVGNVDEEQKRVEPDTTMKGISCSGEVLPKRRDLDYIDEKQDNKKQRKVAKKRRKPIKERLLKSLM